MQTPPSTPLNPPPPPQKKKHETGPQIRQRGQGPAGLPGESAHDLRPALPPPHPDLLLRPAHVLVRGARASFFVFCFVLLKKLLLMYWCVRVPFFFKGSFLKELRRRGWVWGCLQATKGAHRG